MSFLENKVALITGAGAGIGRASALLFSQEGAKMALFSRTKSTVDETADLIRDNGGKVVVIVGVFKLAGHQKVYVLASGYLGINTANQVAVLSIVQATLFADVTGFAKLRFPGNNIT